MFVCSQNQTRLICHGLGPETQVSFSNLSHEWMLKFMYFLLVSVHPHQLQASFHGSGSKSVSVCARRALVWQVYKHNMSTAQKILILQITSPTHSPKAIEFRQEKVAPDSWNQAARYFDRKIYDKEVFASQHEHLFEIIKYFRVEWTRQIIICLEIHALIWIWRAERNWNW